MKKGITLLLLILLPLLSSAQQYTVQGVITDTCGNALSSAGVSIYSLTDYSLKTNAPCDSLGKYNIKLDKGQYAIGFACAGYDSQIYSIPVDSDVSIGTIALKKAAIALDEVEVTATRSPYKLSGQTILVDVENSNLLRHQNDVYELLGKVPGVIKFGNSINVGGKGAPIYYVNGRKVLNQAEVDNLQVDNIKSIKVLFKSDGTYDANGSPVVDITTKRNGDGLAINASSRTEQAKHLSLKDGFSSSYNTSKWDFYLDYYYGHSKTSTKEHDETEITNQSIWDKNYRNHSWSRDNNHYYHIGTAYHLSDKSQIGLRYTGYYANSGVNSFDSLAIASNDELSSTVNTDHTGHSHSNNQHINAYYDAELGHSWSVNASADYVHSESKDRDYYVETGSANDTYKYDGDAHWNVYSANLHLSHQFGKYGTLRFGYDFSHTQGTDGIVYDRAQYNGNTKNRETRNSLFANYELPYGTFTLNAGLRYENVHSKLRETFVNTDVRNHYNKLLPSLSLSQSSGFFMQSLGYSLETNRPYYSNMNDNEIYSNRYSLNKGNINLRTEVSHNISYMLMYKYLLVTLNYNYFHHPIMNYFYGDDQNSPTEISTMTNFSHKQALTAMINFQPTIKCWTPDLSVTVMKTFIHYPGVNGETYHDGKPIVMATFSNDWQLPKDLIISAGYQQTFGGYLQMIRIKPFSTFDISLKKSFFNDRLRISLNASDIFNGNRNKTRIRMNNMLSNMYTKYETRKFGITITYRFRNVKEKNSSNSAKDEMRRLNINENKE